jgi:hypothetical protein
LPIFSATRSVSMLSMPMPLIMVKNNKKGINGY